MTFTWRARAIFIIVWRTRNFPRTQLPAREKLPARENLPRAQLAAPKLRVREVARAKCCARGKLRARDAARAGSFLFPRSRTSIGDRTKKVPPPSFRVTTVKLPAIPSARAAPAQPRPRRPARNGAHEIHARAFVGARTCPRAHICGIARRAPRRVFEKRNMTFTWRARAIFIIVWRTVHRDDSPGARSVRLVSEVARSVQGSNNGPQRARQTLSYQLLSELHTVFIWRRLRRIFAGAVPSGGSSAPWRGRLEVGPRATKP